MIASRSLWARIQELDREIRAGRFPNCTSFAKRWEVSRKTIQRDIDFLRDRFHAPLAYDARRRGYRYTEDTWTLPAIEISEGELVQLLLAERMARQYEGTPLAETLGALFAKIQALLRDPVTLDPLLLETRFSFHGMPARPVSRETWFAVVKALRRRRVLRLRYRDAMSERVFTRTVEPVHLANVGGEWYLVAYCREKKALRNFALSRIREARVERERFPPREFDPETYFSNRFVRFIGEPGEAYWIKVRFSKAVAHWVLERTWHAEQEVRRHRDGSVTLSFPAPALYEVKRWVLQWGADAEVLGPRRLREAVREEAARLQARYS